jgi:hypothetical protein
MKNLFTITFTLLTICSVKSQDFQMVVLQPLESQILEVKFKLTTIQELSKPSVIQQLGIVPYIYNKHIQGTGEKFAMAGVYVNFYQDRIKLNLNNISGYMFTSAPWALVSLNFQM